MTKSLSCRDVERLMLEGEDRVFSAGEERLVEDHLRGCARCRGFAADRALVRGGLADIRWPAPPEELVSRTRRMLRADSTAAPAALPLWILVALAAITVVTTLWLAVSLADVTPGMTLADLPVAGLAAIFFIIQNALMLFCAPVLLRTYRARRGDFEGAR